MEKTKKLLSLLLTVALVLTIVPFSGISVSAYDSPLLNSDGYYEISTADHLYWFAKQVNSGNNTINGVLMNDIAVNEEDDDPNDDVEIAWSVWNPIGTSQNAYQGTFDGAGYTITNMIGESNYDSLVVGVFGYNEGTIKNLNIDKSTFEGRYETGTICGMNAGTIENCHNFSQVSGTSEYAYVGGITGMNTGTIKNSSNSGTITSISTYTGGICGGACGTIEKCYNTGEVSGVDCVGGVAGGNAFDTELVLSDCYNTGEVNGGYYVGGICGSATKTHPWSCYNTGTVTGTGTYVGALLGLYYFNYIDLYSAYLAGCATDGNGTVQNGTGTSTVGSVFDDHSTLTNMKGATEAEFASGEVAYLLNKSVTDGTQSWYQNIDNGEETDAFPQFKGATVYKNEVCAEAGLKYEYSNTFALPQHTFVSGVCSVCGEKESAKLVTSSNYEELGLAEDYIGYYAIYNASDLYWFAEQVNAGENTINGVLMNDIVVNEGDLSGYDGVSENTWRTWNPIGNCTYINFKYMTYSGVFDGAGYKISGLYFNDTSTSYVGLFGYNFGTIKNVGVENSYFNGNQEVGGICGVNEKGTIINCYNTGAVTGVGYYVGGVCGRNLNEIKNCYNTGIVTGTSDYVGGICGFNTSSSEVSYCYNIGTVKGGKAFVGGVCGENWGTKTSYCYYLSGCATDGSDTVQYGIGADTVGSSYKYKDYYAAVTQGKTADQFASGEVAYLLNSGVTDSTQAWYQNLDNGEEVDASPKLVGGTVYNCVDICPEEKSHYTNNLDCVGKFHSFENGVCTECGVSFINPWKSQIRFDTNEDGSFAGTFDYRVLATITSDDLLNTFGTENLAVQSMVEAGFVMMKGTDVSDFDYEIAENVVKGTSTAYTKVPVDYISTNFDTDTQVSGAGDYVISCIVEDIPQTDKNMYLATMAYIVYNDADGNLCYMFYPAINAVCFEGLYDTYYPQAFPF